MVQLPEITLERLKLAFNVFETVPAIGFKSLNVSNVGFMNRSFKDLTRFLFNPADYTVARPEVDGANCSNCFASIPQRPIPVSTFMWTFNTSVVSFKQSCTNWRA